MKKFLFASLFLIPLLFTGTLDAQHTRPRVGIHPNENNTFTHLSFTYVMQADTTGADTVKLFPGTYESVATTTIKDSLTYAVKSVTGCWFGDKLTFNMLNATGSGHKVKFTNKVAHQTAVKPFVFSISAADSSITLNSGKGLYMSFVFNGVQWIEVGKVVQ
jgi:hypothetical protein